MAAPPCRLSRGDGRRPRIRLTFASPLNSCVYASGPRVFNINRTIGMSTLNFVLFESCCRPSVWNGAAARRGEGLRLYFAASISLEFFAPLVKIGKSGRASEGSLRRTRKYNECVVEPRSPSETVRRRYHFDTRHLVSRLATYLDRRLVFGNHVEEFVIRCQSVVCADGDDNV